MELIKCIRYSIFMFHLFAGGCAIITQNYEAALLCVSLLWINNVIFSLEKWKDRFIFFWFHCMVFMFLMSRPIISVFKGYMWKYYTDEAMTFVFLSLWLTMITMQLGAIMYEEFKRVRDERSEKGFFQTKQKHNEYAVHFQESLQIVSLLIYIVSTIAYLYLQMEKLLFMRGKMYYEFYTSFTSQAPYLFHVLASFKIYSLGIFLATRPKKKLTFVVLASYILVDFPVLLYGKRSLIMTDALFILIYYLMRNGMDREEKWIGKIEKVCLCIGAPIAVVAMGAMNYLRDGASVSLGIGDLLLDFLYKQGVSFNVLNLGYQSIPYLPDRVFRNYTFGGIIDYFTHGMFAQKFFGAESLGDGNNLMWALKSNSFAHNMSYVATEDYLEGHGLGSSYLLEVFTDYGYIGVILFSLLLGAMLVWFVHAMQKMNFLSMIILIAMPNIFFMPRGEATGAISFLVYAQFWAVVVVCYVGAGLIARSYSYGNLSKAMKERKKICLNTLD